MKKQCEEDHILRLLQQQKRHYKMVLIHMEEEKKIYQTIFSISSLLSSLKKKGILLSCIEEIEEQLKPFYEDEKWPVWKKNRPEIEKEIEATKAVLCDIMACDDQNQYHFRLQCAEWQSELCQSY